MPEWVGYGETACRACIELCGIRSTLPCRRHHFRPLSTLFFGPLVLNFLFASILGINFHFISQSVQTRLYGL
ncbi:hypothetical protein COCCADRAFT_103788 [Bipolaris zeicola 26-R-13]|uniref:Uncharacterized protein n=1 Tax=Cochliobolus carbonum (strain 26-R-13) TaxID=930089 RepID=W6XXK1_COCC2|nr:uncharacterized protein COCCADRAFT_103788 [Bipolaris zeicola 26-R-13]EUC30493.1 hypothetical protein COCCADRAFT_103788 [Bipolaris zeicola 26-R-13]